MQKKACSWTEREKQKFDFSYQNFAGVVWMRCVQTRVHGERSTLVVTLFAPMNIRLH